MKKLLLFLCAFLASLTVGAQNLALNKTAISTSGTAGNAVDGNTGSRWESEHSDLQTWQVDLGEAATFNTIVILWEGAYGKTFTIEAGNEVDGDGYLTGGTQIIAITDQSLAGFPYKQTLKFDNTTARYIKFNGIARGTQYGYSFWEFEVYNIGEQTLASLLLSPANADKADESKSACKVGESILITPKAKDTENIDYPTDGIVYSATNGTITEAGVFTPAAKGLCTITATLGDKNATATIYAYEGDNLLLNKTGVTNSEATNVNLFFNGNWGDRGGLGKPGDGHTWVYVDLDAYYTIDLVDIKQEQACGKNYTIQFSHDGESWTSAYTVENEAGMAGDVRHYFYGSSNNTDVRYVRFDCTEPATEWGVSIYEFAAYGVKTGDVADDIAPVLDIAEVAGTSPSIITLRLKATDETASVISYIITNTSDANHSYTTTGNSGEEIFFDLTGLESGVNYTFSVVAKDSKNLSVSQNVSATTSVLTDVPVPTATNVIPVYGTALGNADNYGFNDWDGGGSGKSITINSVTAYEIDNFRWFGSQFDALDASSMTTLHFDIYPYKTTTLAIIPINGKVEGAGNQPEKGYQFDVIGGQWNALEIPVSTIVADGVTMTKFYQIKYVSKVVNKAAVGASDGFENGDGTLTFIVGNVYLYGDEIADTEAPVMTKAEATTVKDTKVTLTVSATDNSNGTLTYSVKNGASEIATVTGKAGDDATIEVTGLTPETTYNLSVTATDAKGNVSTAMSVAEFTTEETPSVIGTSGTGVTGTNGGGTAGLEYSYDFVEDATGVNVTFTCTNASNYTGLVSYVWNNTAGFSEIGSGDASITKHLDYAVGTTIKVACKWAYAGGMSVTDYIEYTLQGASTSTVTANVGTYQWATFCSDKDLDFTNVTDVKAYIVTGMENGAVTTQLITGTVKAGTGMLLNSDAAGSFDIPLATGETTDYSATNKMHGVTEAIETVGKADAGYTNYVLSVVDGKAAFKYVNATSAELTKGQAYLQLEGDVQSSAPVLSIVGDGEATGISSLENESLIKDGVYYDLSGRRVSQPTKGLYILNGKKVIIK